MNKQVLAAWLCAGCWAAAEQAQAQPLPEAPPAAVAAQAVSVPRNLYRVDERLYRSEQLQQQDVVQLQLLGVKTVVNLRFFNRDEDVRQLAAGRFRLLSRPILTWRVRPQDVAAALWAIEQSQAAGPVLVHCYHGADRTGLVVGMYRIIYQHWPIAEAKAEMMQGPYGFHPVWRNIAAYFSEEKVAAVRRELAKLRRQG